MRYAPRPRVTALTFLLLGLIAGSTLAAPAKPAAPGPPPQAGDLPVVEGGRTTGQKTAEAARQDGLTVLDLSDEWLPGIFSETPDKPQPLRPYLIDLANGRFRAGTASVTADAISVPYDESPGAHAHATRSVRLLGLRRRF